MRTGERGKEVVNVTKFYISVYVARMIRFPNSYKFLFVTEVHPIEMEL